MAATLLATLLSLGIVSYINGGQLQFVNPAQFGRLSARTEGLEAEASALGNMRVISGEWSQENGIFTQTNADFDDFVLSTGVFAGVYSLETSITLPQEAELQDAGGGIIFHMPGMDSRQNAHLVRLAGGGNGVFWGYFDENEEFVGQGWSAFEPGEQEEQPFTFKIRIVVQRDTYDLYVNDLLVAEDNALINQDGFIGLLAYRGPIIFDQIGVTIGETQ